MDTTYHKIPMYLGQVVLKPILPSEDLPAVNAEDIEDLQWISQSLGWDLNQVTLSQTTSTRMD